MNNEETYMRRCFDLARLGAGSVSPNPCVGAVLVHKDRIIGEGWHQAYGEAHAEVNAVKSVADQDRHLIKEATLYVSLEPCNIQGKTPPCTGLILREGIEKVVISCIDQTPEVKGEGIALLKRSGVEVEHGVLQEEGERVSAFRNTFTAKNRPYIQLKFARTRNGFMGVKGQQVWISNLFSKRLAHRFRAEYDAILIGTQTALTDDPQLTNRLWFGNPPFRVVLDRQLQIPTTHKIFDETTQTIIVTEADMPKDKPDHVSYFQFDFDKNLLKRILSMLVDKKVTSLIVEGGAHTLQSFINEGLWDEALVFTGAAAIKEGIPAPLVPGHLANEWKLGDDVINLFFHKP